MTRRWTAALAVGLLLTACGNTQPPVGRPVSSEAGTTVASSPGDSGVTVTRPSEIVSTSAEPAPPSAGSEEPTTTAPADSVVEVPDDAADLWAAAIDEQSAASTMKYLVESGFSLGAAGGFDTVRTVQADRDAGTLQIDVEMSVPEGMYEDMPEGGLGFVTVMSPDGVFMHMPGWVENRPELEGKWLEISQDQFDGAEVPAELALLDFEVEDYFPIPELILFEALSAQQVGEMTVLRGDLPAAEAVSLLGMNNVFSESPESVLALTGTVPAEVVLDASGSLVSAELIPKEHGLDAGGDPVMQQLIMALPYSYSVLTMLSIDEPVTITVPAPEDRFTDFPN